MSKPCSGHFIGTTGRIVAVKNSTHNQQIHDIITAKGLDTREHPTKYKQLNSKKLKTLREKFRNHTITKEEYKRLQWHKRLTSRRNEGIKQFWKEERKRIMLNLPTTRNWSADQRRAILNKETPRFKGRPIASHHLYSVAKYPHLSNLKEIIYPVTYVEHIYGYHGGNPRNSLPGIPIKHIKEF